MKITLKISAILNDIYADSAIAAAIKGIDPKYTVPLLTRQHRYALRRVAVNAAAFVASSLTSHLLAVTFPESEDDPDAAIIFEISDDTTATPDALKLHFANAVTFQCLHLIALNAADYHRADAYNRCASQTADAIMSCIDNAPVAPAIRPSYY